MKKITGQSSSDQTTVSLRPSLLKRLDRYCFKKELQRSQVISKAVKRFLAAEMGDDDPAFWDELYDKYDIDGKF